MPSISFLKSSTANGSISATTVGTSLTGFFSGDGTMEPTDIYVAVFLHEYALTSTTAAANGFTHLGTLGPQQYRHSTGPDVYRNVHLSVYYKTISESTLAANGMSVTQSSSGRNTAFGGVFRCDTADRVPTIAETLSLVSENATDDIPIPEITATRDGEMHLYIGAGAYWIPYSEISGTTSFKGSNAYSYTGVDGVYIARNTGGSNTGGGIFSAGTHSDPSCQLSYAIRLIPAVRPDTLTDSTNIWAEPEHQDSPDMTGGDPRWAYLEFLYHCDGVQDADRLVDSGPNDYSRDLIGGATDDTFIDTVVKKYGTGSLRHTGNTNASSPWAARGYVDPITLTTPLGTSDWTFEFFVRSVNLGQPTVGGPDDYNYVFFMGPTAWNDDYVCLAQDTQWGLELEIYNRIAGVWTGFSLDTYTEPFVFETGIWYHNAIVKRGDRFDWYVDGVRTGDGGTGIGWGEVPNFDLVGDQIIIGNVPDLGNNGYNGYFDEIRLTRLARYVDEFTPPTVAFLGIPPEILAAATALISSFNAADVATGEFRFYRTATGRAQMSSATAVQLFFKPIIADGTSLRDTPISGWPLALAETFNLPVATVITRAHRVIEALQLTNVLDPTTTYTRAINEGIRALDLLARFTAGAVVESLTTEALVAPVSRFTPTATGAVTLTSTATSQFVIRVVTNESLDLSADKSLRLLFQPVISENTTISLAYVAPGDSVTTWAVNARTGAVTEYTNYNFNSFAEVGRQYLGATSTGLYELADDDDAGDSIISKFKSGLLQFAGSRLVHMKGAYIGVRGAGDFILRIETTDGAVRDYAVTTESMKTSRIQLGKGIRARYFAFELESTGQDFDLENIKFVPLIASRRI